MAGEELTNWQMTWLNLLALALMGLFLKAFALLVPKRLAGTSRATSNGATVPSAPKSQRGVPAKRKVEPWTLQFILTPVLAPNSLERSQPLSAAPAFFLRAGFCLGALLLYYWIYWKLVAAFHLRGIILGYLTAPVVLLMTEVFIAIVTLLWLPSGRLLPALHRNPFAARSLAEFWGRRWNLWMSDWFRYAIFAPLHRRPVLAVWLIFFLSGLLHEYLLNLTLWFVTGRKLFGTMMLYFLLQGAGVLMERRVLRRGAPANRLFTWLIVLAPVPFVFHESMLRMLHLWPN